MMRLKILNSKPQALNKLKIKNSKPQTKDCFEFMILSFEFV